MQTWLNYLWDALRERLWFIPSLFSLVGVAAAVVLLSIDHQLDGHSEWLPSPLRTTGSAARTVLGALIGGLVTVAGLVFSLTMLLVSQMASQYGPRLIRNVFDGNLTQSTLGLFLGTIVYSMIVLRSIRDLTSGEAMFTPNLSILLAEVLGAACIFSLLAFTSHMSRCMRAETLIESIFEDLKSTADRIYPEAATEETDASLQPKYDWPPIEQGEDLRTQHVGYLQAIDLKPLIQIAEEQDMRFEIKRSPGDFVYSDGLLMTADLGQWNPSNPANPSNPGRTSPTDSERREAWKPLESRIRGCFLIGMVRTPRQDIEAGLMELVEAGVRALSSGVNDPTTAINAIDYLTSILCDLAKRTWPRAMLADSNDVPRILSPHPSFADILGTAFDQLRQFSTGMVAVQCRLLDGMEMIAHAATRVEDLQAVRRQAEMILRHAEKHIDEPNDLLDVQERYERVVTRVARHGS